MHQLLGIYICEKTIIMMIILLLLIPQTTSCPPVTPINAFPSQHSIEKWYITHLPWKNGDQPNLLSNSLFSGVLTGLLVPSSKITKLLDTPCNTPSCWKVSGKAFLMPKNAAKATKLGVRKCNKQAGQLETRRIIQKIRHGNTCSTCFACMYTWWKWSDFREAFLIAKLIPYGKMLMLQSIMLHKFMAQKFCTLVQLGNLSHDSIRFFCHPCSV